MAPPVLPVNPVPRPPVLGIVRRADDTDVAFIMELLNEAMKMTFRCETLNDILVLIKYAVLSICQLDVDGNVIGFLSLKDYPNIPSIHPKAWEEYVWTKYKTTELRSRNTLFIHMLCWAPTYSREVVDNMMRTVFMHDAYLDYIALSKSLPEYPLLMPGQSRAEASFRRYQAMERGVPPDHLPTLNVVERKGISPRLRIRRAVEEDNDDLVPIIERYSPRLRELYGEFYISELIARHPESNRKLFVCEHNELAVGVMCLNTDINYDALEDNYELSIYAGLKRNPKSKLKLIQSIPSASNSTSKVTYEEKEVINISHELTDIEDEEDEDDDKIVSVLNTRDLNEPSIDKIDIMFASKLMYLEIFDEDEEFEFDIVNIDQELIRVLPMLSYHELGSDTSFEINIPKPRASEKNLAAKQDIKQKRLAATPSIKMSDRIKFSGLPNAFVIELFAMHQDYDDRYGFDMLEAAFELFPDRDYCIISLPSNHSAFPLLEHFTSVVPTANKYNFVKETLYVTHKNSIKGSLAVRSGELGDITKVDDVIEHSAKRSSIMEYFITSLSSQTIESFVLLSENQPVGVLVMGPLRDGALIRTQFELPPDPPRQNTDAYILASVISPLFEQHFRWFFREVIRQSEYTTIFWNCRLIGKGDLHPKYNMMSLASHMVPVRSRSLIPSSAGKQPLEHHIYKQLPAPTSLWFIERPLTSIPRVDVNHSIVVIGASTTGLAFIEALIMGSCSTYLAMMNITLVSEHGLPSVPECLRAADICIPRSGRYTDRYVKTVPFFFYIDVVTALMVNIDRDKKCIYFKEGGCKYYDILVLTCGLQFQHPHYLKESMKIEKLLQEGKPCERMLMDNPKYIPDQVPPLPELPENVMLINSIFDSNQCFRRLMTMIGDGKIITLSSEVPIIVYGENLEAYSCMAALLDLGISGDKIVFIEPFPPEDPTALRVNYFNNHTVDERVQKEIQNQGIKIYRGCYFIGWVTDHSGKATCLRVVSQYKIIQLPCFAFFYYGLKAIDINSFKAINECGLVYDGGLVIGADFETNDPNIYGAGPSTKYSRRLYAAPKMHRNYCSEEIGETLAKIFLRKLDPFVMAAKRSSLPDILPHYSSNSLLSCNFDNEKEYSNLSSGDNNAKWRPVIKFEEPIITWSILPGPLYYYKLRPPGVELPMEVASSLPKQGHTLITDHKNNYFRLQLNALHCVVSITCLSRDVHQPEIFAHMYMKHENYFNGLLKRYQCKLIDDFYDYFCQPWMDGMNQEIFENLLDDIRNQEMGTVYDLARSKFRFSLEKGLDKPPKSSRVDKPPFGFGPKDVPNLGTFREILRRNLGKLDENQEIYNQKVKEVPSVCGQSAGLRDNAADFWSAVEGERMVLAHLGRYLTKYRTSNPNYAKVKL